MTIQQLAAKYAQSFITKERKNGDKFICLKDKTSPLNEDDANLSQLIYSAHDGMLPDDYRYQFIYETLEYISENDDIDDIQIEPDIYNHDLLKWVSSNLTRASYVDEAVKEHEYHDFFQAIMNGQLKEKEEILYSVRSSLESIIENMKEDNQ